ncbi:hypothetical protein JR312_06005 [Wolbachia endosymbiont of Nasonia giraulti]
MQFAGTTDGVIPVLRHWDDIEGATGMTPFVVSAIE